MGELVLQHWGDLAGPAIVVICRLYSWVGLRGILHVTSKLGEPVHRLEASRPVSAGFR